MKFNIKKLTFSVISITSVITIAVPVGIYSSSLKFKNNKSSNIENKSFPGIQKYQKNDISINNEIIKSSVKNGVFYLNFNFEEKQKKLTNESYTTFIIQSSTANNQRKWTIYKKISSPY